VSAYNNAGFNLTDNSLIDYAGDEIINLVICISTILGGLGFIVLNELFFDRRKKQKRLSFHTKVVLITSAVFVFFPALIMLITEYNNSLSQLPWDAKILAALFQSVNTRSGGFYTVSLNHLLPATQFLFIFTMFIGCSPGSTGGGIKTTTFAILLSTIISQARGKKEAELWRYSISPVIINRALCVLVFYVTILMLVTFLLLSTHQGEFMPILFEVTSALGTVGLSLNFTPQLSVFGKLLIIFTMYIGRVGPLTLAFALAYKAKQPEIRYPAGKITIG
ncbi:MAG: hypothetical protein LBK69_01785, partial [Syntrophomonadaceae bacterium]|nr:hypothetical protein [Syntrophomonadaceae bacterium]